MFDQLPEVATALKLFDYPLNINFRTAFGTPPDLFGRYAMGLGFDGQPVYEVLNDFNADNSESGSAAADRCADRAEPQQPAAPRHVGRELCRLRPTSSTRSLQQNDDAPFATTDLERVLRAFDADAGMLPSRLWDVVDVFDPLKLRQFDPLRVQA